jgi:alpha-1,6-mannosyltransferase
LLPLAYLGRKAGCNVYLFAHERLDKVIDAFLPRLRTIGFLVKAWNKISVLCVDAVIATTKMASLEFLEIDKYMRKHGRVLRQIPLGVNLEMFVPLRSGNDVAGYLFACTRFSKEKDPIFLIEIMREIKNLGRDIRLKVAGSGPMLDEFKNQVVAEDLPIDLLGFVREKEELNSLMSHASIFLAVGPIETFGLAALECLASGTPVICRDTSAIVEIIDFNSGMSASRSAKQWSNLIIEILDGDRFLWSTGARRRAENFSWTTTASRLLSLSQRDLLRQ